MSYLKQNRKQIQTLESAQYSLKIIFNTLWLQLSVTNVVQILLLLATTAKQVPIYSLIIFDYQARG